MAQIVNATMSLAALPKEVVIKVSYDLQFSEHEKQTLSTGSPAMWFTEHIDILGAAEKLSFPSESLQVQGGIITRQRSSKEQRDLLQRGVLPTALRCRITVLAHPPSGATAETNTVVLPNSGVVPYVPLKRLVPAIGALVAVVAAVALLRPRR
jgi:hypothetical protein